MRSIARHCTPLHATGSAIASEGPGVVKFLPEHLTGIIIGDRASQSTVDKVNEWTLKRPMHWTVYRASVSKDRFALEIAPA